VGTDYNPRIVTNGLVLCLDAGNVKSYPGTGTIWSDLSGQGNHGTMTACTYASTLGGSIVFNGTTSKVATSPGANFAYGTGDYAMEFWFRDTSTPATAFANLWTQTIAGENYFVIGVGANKITFWPVHSAPLSTLTTSTYVSNAWTHLVVTRVASTAYIYLNGVADATATKANTVNSTNTTYVPTIGQYSHYGYVFTGDIPIVRIYKGYGFTQSIVTQNFNASRKRFGL